MNQRREIRKHNKDYDDRYRAWQKLKQDREAERLKLTQTSSLAQPDDGKWEATKDERERWRGHKWFDNCERFCGAWDQMAFDPDYPTKPLSHFEPMLCEVFSRTPFDPAVINPETAA